jgi:hypothetical protein
MDIILKKKRFIKKENKLECFFGIFIVFLGQKNWEILVKHCFFLVQIRLVLLFCWKNLPNFRYHKFEINK